MVRRLMLVALSVLALSLTLAGVVAAVDTGTKQVGVVIAFPNNTTHTEIVTVPITATAFDVVKAAKVNLVSQTTSFGPAVCSINSVGCPAANCFCDPKQFWAYYHLTGNAWTVAAEGANSYVPANGAVEGFVWSGMDAKFNPTAQPPVMTFAQIVAAPKLLTLPTTGGSGLWLIGGGLGGLALAAAGLAVRSRPARR
ncbi:MAG: hypothetical protein QG637_1053 [Chloroflexota bacterium]|nr:hypothetical protein [Chloroflexota bacterium]